MQAETTGAKKASAGSGGNEATATRDSVPRRKEREQTSVQAQVQEQPRERSRDVPAAVQREVFTRDSGRCGFVDERGQRCRETRYLELHHLHPFAMAGAHIASNLALRCAAHNALAAEEDFGLELIEDKREERGTPPFLSKSRRASRALEPLGAAREQAGARLWLG